MRKSGKLFFCQNPGKPLCCSKGKQKKKKIKKRYLFVRIGKIRTAEKKIGFKKPFPIRVEKRGKRFL